MSEERRRARTWAALVAILLIGALLRVALAWQRPVWIDESIGWRGRTAAILQLLRRGLDRALHQPASAEDGGGAGDRSAVPSPSTP
jgi:hypothetical protein